MLGIAPSFATGSKTHLRHDPTKVSRSRIKRLRGRERPQYRLCIEDIRVFYDVVGGTVEVLAIVSKSQVARETGDRIMKKVALSEIKDQLSKYLRLAERDEVVITRHGRPAGVLIGFASEDDWFEYRLQRDPRFLAWVESARASLRAGKGKRLADIED